MSERISITELREILKNKELQYDVGIINYHIKTNPEIKDLFTRAGKIGNTRMFNTKDLPKLIKFLKSKKRRPKGYKKLSTVKNT